MVNLDGGHRDAAWTMSKSFDPYLRWLGIRDPQRPPNHYRLLGVELFEDDRDVLSHAADRQMAHVRTFQTGKHSLESQRLLNELAAATVCLLSPNKKAEYDTRLRVMNRDPIVMAVSQEVVKQSYTEAGRPDAYNDDDVALVASDQFSYVAAVGGR